MDDHLNIFRVRSPAGAVAMEVLLSLAGLWEHWNLGDEDDFFEYLIEPMAKDPNLSGQEKSELIKDVEEMTEWDAKPLPPSFKENSVKLALLETACTYAVQAIRAQSAKAPEERVWTFACEAKQFLGILQGYISGVGEPAQISTLAKLGAHAKHAENRAMKAQLFEWCAENYSKFKGTNAAALVVIQTQLPIAFSTAVTWIREWKKLQSAGTL